MVLMLASFRRLSFFEYGKYFIYSHSNNKNVDI